MGSERLKSQMNYILKVKRGVDALILSVGDMRSSEQTVWVLFN